MKRLSTLLFATSLAFAAASCKSKDDTYSSNPYQDNPYYGPQGGATTGTTTSSSDYADVTPAAPANNYTAPAPAAPAYTPPAAPAYTPPAAPANNYGGTSSHTVAKGDTLYNLSKRYGTSITSIQSANGLNSDLIVLGQTLNIPRG